MNVGSLFSGIGGFDLGFERAGMRTVWFCEQDEFCRRVLARHWPGVPCFPDVRALVADTRDDEPQEPQGHDGQHGQWPQVGGRQLLAAGVGTGRRDSGGRDTEGASVDGEDGLGIAGAGGCPVPVPVPYVDVLCGGFPCQDISLAGKGAGIGGARSGLWSEFARLVGELRPRYVVVENVPALLGRGVGRVLGDLAALGFDAEWDCLPASAFGAPHRRDRFWLVAYPGGEQHEGAGYANGRATPAGLLKGVADPQGEPFGTGLCEGESGGLGRGRPGDSGGEVPHAESNGRGQGRQGRPDPSREGEQEPVGPLQDPDERALLPWRVGGRVAQAGGPEWWSVEPPVGRVAHGVPDRLDQLAALGNSLVPQIAEWIGRRILEAEEGRLAA